METRYKTHNEDRICCVCKQPYSITTWKHKLSNKKSYCSDECKQKDGINLKFHTYKYSIKNGNEILNLSETTSSYIDKILGE